MDSLHGMLRVCHRPNGLVGQQEHEQPGDERRCVEQRADRFHPPLLLLRCLSPPAALMPANALRHWIDAGQCISRNQFGYQISFAAVIIASRSRSNIWILVDRCVVWTLRSGRHKLNFGPRTVRTRFHARGIFLGKSPSKVADIFDPYPANILRDLIFCQIPSPSKLLLGGGGCVLTTLLTVNS
jgi:hypothetical protein